MTPAWRHRHCAAPPCSDGRSRQWRARCSSGPSAARRSRVLATCAQRDPGMRACNSRNDYRPPVCAVRMVSWQLVGCLLGVCGSEPFCKRNAGTTTTGRTFAPSHSRRHRRRRCARLRPSCPATAPAACRTSHLAAPTPTLSCSSGEGNTCRAEMNNIYTYVHTPVNMYSYTYTYIHSCSMSSTPG